MKIPITLITGYLGAGKTTLLRHILDSADRKITVLINEFGQIGIDADIVKGKNIDMIELKGGCVCCSLTGEFEAALKEIKEKIDPEIIIIETTGVAEPDAIVGDITENIEGVRLDAVVTVVDADAMIRFPSIGYTGRMQIEMADVIVLNKSDLVEDEKLGEVEDALKRINPDAPIFRTSYAKIENDLLLDLNIERKMIAAKEHDHRKHIERENIGHFAYTSGKRLSKSKLENLLFDLPKDIFRAKGFLVTDEGSFLMNFVYGRFDFEEFETESNRMVFIGKNADKHSDSITGRIKECEIT